MPASRRWYRGNESYYWPFDRMHGDFCGLVCRPRNLRLQQVSERQQGISCIEKETKPPAPDCVHSDCGSDSVVLGYIPGGICGSNSGFTVLASASRFDPIAGVSGATGF